MWFSAVRQEQCLLVLCQSFCYDVIFLTNRISEMHTAKMLDKWALEDSAFGELRQKQQWELINLQHLHVRLASVTNTCKKRGIQPLLKEYAMWFENTSIELHPAPAEVNGLNDFNGSQIKLVTALFFFSTRSLYLPKIEFLRNQTGITSFSRSKTSKLKAQRCACSQHIFIFLHFGCQSTACAWGWQSRHLPFKSEKQT